ncbi:MAG TPA: serine/threonine-protein kinase [Kofleriaceae bacterium]|nr:serine/threonine-protein kinase [Kofleriaceae bacterium]
MRSGEPRIGDVLDSRYRITGRLGAGAMGSVYRGEHVAIRKPVAIKILHADFAADPDYARRFEREAFVTGRTDHPNCVHASNFGPLAGGGFYLVMDLVDGQLLADVLDGEGALASARALHIARHVLRGLAHVHAAGIVHRDVKPANVILVDEDGDPDFAKILDFGVAKMIDTAVDGSDQNQLTVAGTTVGTPLYVAPEQVVGAGIDARSDLYSVSIMLYEMLTGHTPFEDEDAVKLVTRHLSSPVPRMIDVAPDVAVAPAVEALVARGLEKERAARWQSADDMIAAIDGVVARGEIDPPAAAVAAVAQPLENAAQPIQTPATVRKGPRRQWSNGRRAIALAAAVLAGLLLIALAARMADDDGEAAAAHEGVHAASAKEPENQAVPAQAMTPVAGVKAATPAAMAAAADPRRDDAIARAKASLAQRQPQKAVAILRETLGDKLTDDAEAQIVLGHAQMFLRRRQEGLAAYGRAAHLDLSRARASQHLRRDVESLLTLRRDPIRIAALDLLAELDDDAARQKVIAAALDRKNPMRHRARDLAAAHGYLARIDQLASYALDLRYEKTCEERATAVVHLRNLDDPRAIPILERARRRRAGGFLGIGDHRANPCMDAAIDEAITHLTAQSPPSP